jgi:hypothetical protein
MPAPRIPMNFAPLALAAALLAAPALCAALPAAPAIAAPDYDPTPQYVTAPGEKELWVRRIRDAREVVEAARARLVEARDTYSRMRHTNKARGEKREAVREGYERAQRELVEAEQGLDAVLERARRAGVPPGWVREALEGFDTSPAKQG